MIQKYRKKPVAILLIALVAIVLGGCDDVTTETHRFDYQVGTISKFEFEGHTYLIRNIGHQGGICHDENCKCKTEYKYRE